MSKALTISFPPGDRCRINPDFLTQLAKQLNLDPYFENPNATAHSETDPPSIQIDYWTSETRNRIGILLTEKKLHFRFSPED